MAASSARWWGNDGASQGGRGGGGGGGGGRERGELPSSRRSASVDPRHFGGGASRSNVSSSWSQWGRETVRAGKERPLTPTETGLLMLPSIDESPTARRMDRRNELYQSPTQRATFISPQHVRNKDDMSPSPSSRRFINVMQKTLAYDQKYDPHTLNRGMPREIMQAVSVIESKIRDYSEGMLRAFRNIDVSKTGMITQRELGELLARFGALTDARHFDVVWDMMDNERKGSIHFFTFITKFKHGLSHELLTRAMPDSAATPAPSMHRSQYVPSTEHGAHAMRGKGGTKTVGSVMGEVHFSDHVTHKPRYLNVFPFHTGISSSANPVGLNPYNPFLHDTVSAASLDPRNEVYLTGRKEALRYQNQSEVHATFRGEQSIDAPLRSTMVRQLGVPQNDNGWHGWRHGEKRGSVQVGDLLRYQEQGKQIQDDARQESQDGFGRAMQRHGA